MKKTENTENRIKRAKSIVRFNKETNTSEVVKVVKETEKSLILEDTKVVAKDKAISNLSKNRYNVVDNNKYYQLGKSYATDAIKSIFNLSTLCDNVKNVTQYYVILNTKSFYRCQRDKIELILSQRDYDLILAHNETCKDDNNKFKLEVATAQTKCKAVLTDIYKTAYNVSFSNLQDITRLNAILK